jgi:hypothetical protein
MCQPTEGGDEMADDEVQDLVDKVRRLSDLDEIKQLRARYTRYIDTQDWEGMRSVITADFYSETDRGRIDGRDEVIATVSGSLAGASTAHHCHTPEITITGPDSATAIWAMQDHVKVTLNGAPFSFRGAGHYHETYVRTPEGWRISSSTLKRLSVDPLTTGPSPAQ